MKALNSCVTGMYGKDMLRIRIRAVTSWCGRIPAERMFCACARELLPNCDRIFKEKTVCALAWEPLPQVWQDPCRKNVLRMPKRALTSTVTGSLWKRQSAHWHENFYLRCDRIPVERMFCACPRELLPQLWQDLYGKDSLRIGMRTFTSGVTGSLWKECSAHAQESSSSTVTESLWKGHSSHGHENLYLRCDRISVERMFWACARELLPQVWQNPYGEDALHMRMRALTSGVTGSLWRECSAHAHEISYFRCDRIRMVRTICACAWELLSQVWQDPCGENVLRMRMRSLTSGVTGSVW
jgi:hypothetical protein